MHQGWRRGQNLGSCSRHPSLEGEHDKAETRYCNGHKLRKKINQEKKTTVMTHLVGKGGVMKPKGGKPTWRSKQDVSSLKRAGPTRHHQAQGAGEESCMFSHQRNGPSK